MVFLALPADAAQAIEHTVDHLLIRRCAFWIKAADLPDSTVAEPYLSFPKTQTFSPATLKALMEQEDRRAARPIGEIA